MDVTDRLATFRRRIYRCRARAYVYVFIQRRVVGERFRADLDQVDRRALGGGRARTYVQSEKKEKTGHQSLLEGEFASFTGPGLPEEKKGPLFI